MFRGGLRKIDPTSWVLLTYAEKLFESLTFAHCVFSYCNL